MDIIIHRGANQIGGCVTEISTEGAKIFIDLGANLPGGPGKELDVENVRKITKGADAIFYTHYHGDHVGLFPFVPEAIPQYIGKGAQEVMLCKYEALNKHYDQAKELNALRRFRNYRTLVPIDINGKIRVTPYFVSHSAFDAYMFKIEVEGKTIFHAGDLNNWHWKDESTEQEVKEAEGNFLHEIKILKATCNNIDIALFPVDPRIGSDFARGAEQFIQQIHVKQFIPMHFWEKPELTLPFGTYAQEKGVSFNLLQQPGESLDI